MSKEVNPASINWSDVRQYYSKVSEAINSHTQRQSKKMELSYDFTAMADVIHNMYDKFGINIHNCVSLIKNTEEHPYCFLSLGLVMRGMVSDLINYKYLGQVYRLAGREAFQNESRILDYEFAKGYKNIFESELRMITDPVFAEKVKAKFAETFKEFIVKGELIKKGEFRTDEFKSKINAYLKSRNMPHNMNLDTEKGKLDFIEDKYIDMIKIVYSYLSQFQHFSNKTFNFYKEKIFMDSNPYYALVVLFFSIILFYDLIHNLTKDEVALSELSALAKEVISLGKIPTSF